MKPAPRKSRLDPRLYQIAVLGTFLIYGLFVLRFDLRLSYITTVIGSALGAQYICGKLFKPPRIEFKSALISSLSLCLLLRTNSLSVAVLAAVIAISSKFLIRIKGKHIFNPTNFGIVISILVSGSAWISPGQWGSFALFAFFASGLGIFVVNRAARSDVTLSFLIFHAAFVFGRAFRLGDPLPIPMHQLANGALLIFAFYMISDPRTTPNSRTSRIVFAFLVAALAHYIRFTYYTPNALIYSLVILSPVVPILDRIFPGRRFDWSSPASGQIFVFPKLEGLDYARKNIAT